MPVAAVAELVRDDGQDLGRRRRVDERVVEDDAPRRAEPRDVGVQLRRALARVGDEHLAHRHARVGGKLHHRGPQLRVLERAELVEDGLEQTGATKLSSSTSSAAPIAATTGHDAGKSTAAPTRPAMPSAGQHCADPDPLHAVERVLPPRLAREAERALVREPEPDRERQPHERREDDEERAEDERAERLGQRIDDAERAHVPAT